MRLTPKQLRKIITEETNKVLREIGERTLSEPFGSVDVPTNKDTSPTKTGNDSAEKVVHDFFSALHKGGFGDIIEIAKSAMRKRDEAVEEEPAPVTLKSPGVSERLLRSYLRMLFEGRDDVNDFMRSVPAVSLLISIYQNTELKGFWNKPFNNEMGKKIFKIVALGTNYDNFMTTVLGKAWPPREELPKLPENPRRPLPPVGAGGQLMWIAKESGVGEARTKIIRFIGDIFSGAIAKLEKDMPPGKGMGFGQDPRVKLNPHGEDPSQRFPLKGGSGKTVDQDAPTIPGRKGPAAPAPPTRKA